MKIINFKKALARSLYAKCVIVNIDKESEVYRGSIIEIPPNLLHKNCAFCLPDKKHDYTTFIIHN